MGAIVSYIATQLGLSTRAWREYEWQGLTIERHRSQIREFLGFRESSLQDLQEVKAWLCEKVLVFEHQETHLEAAVSQRLRELKLEPPSQGQVERLIRSAMRTVEKSFCASIFNQIPSSSLSKLDRLLDTEGALEEDQGQFKQSIFNFLKMDPGRTSLKSILKELEKLQCIRQLELPATLFTQVPPKITHHYRRRASVESPRKLRRHPAPIRYTLVVAFCVQRSQEITNNLIELLNGIIHRIHINAERRVDKELIEDFKRVNGKPNLLFRIAQASLEYPDEVVKEVVYPVVSPKLLQAVVKEYKSSGSSYEQKVYTVMRSSYLHHYRRMVPQILNTLEFRSNNDMHRPVISALELLKKYQSKQERYYSPQEELFINGVLNKGWRDLIVEVDANGHERINRVNYEICVLQVLRDRLRCKEIWVVGARRYCNPEEDLPQDFEVQRETYYQMLNQSLDAQTFIRRLQQEMTQSLSMLNAGMPKNPKVRILNKKRWISLSSLETQPDPLNLLRLKREIDRRWPMTGLLDMLKEADLRIGFTDQFKNTGVRENLERGTLQRRLLLCLYGLGTNTGLKRVCAGVDSDTETDLRYIKKHYIKAGGREDAIFRHTAATVNIFVMPLLRSSIPSSRFGRWRFGVRAQLPVLQMPKSLAPGIRT